MAFILLVMAAGMGVGIWISGKEYKEKLLKIAGKFQTVSLCVLLFTMGSWLGGSGDFWESLGKLGFQGAILALAGIAGSVLAVFLLTVGVRKGDS
ncbi:LysO family transporter [Oscillospiraceae bacterium MB08-C2-2]|nr:LysO family transporter [Oscillospiraceae bacterium MB08-C2-2]